mmetsp:Transcript_5247/g.22261  ORF Transcript_5247/g.22261 Transcript_5247/m.22261 type:complete len:269 (+) Transcript_5247:199-1005(+)
MDAEMESSFSERKKARRRADPPRRKRFGPARRAHHDARVFDGERTREGVKIAPSRLCDPSKKNALVDWFFGFLNSRVRRRVDPRRGTRFSSWNVAASRLARYGTLVKARATSAVNRRRIDRPLFGRSIRLTRRRLRGASSGCASPATSTRARPTARRGSRTRGGAPPPRAPRAEAPPATRRSRRGAPSGVSERRAARARAARRRAASACPVAPSPAPPRGSSAPASVPSARASRADSPVPSASAASAAAAPCSAPARRRTGCAREAPA